MQGLRYLRRRHVCDKKLPKSLTYMVFAVALALVAVGCSSATSDPTIEAAIEDTTIASPLNYLLKIDEDGSQSLDEAEASAQEEIADCMAERGFPYTPVIDSTPLGQRRELPDITTVEDAENYGYGISDNLRVDIELFQLGENVGEDPNQVYIDALSEEESAAYQLALTGLSPGEIDWSGPEPVDAATGETLTSDQLRERAIDGCGPAAYYAMDIGLSKDVTRFLESNLYTDLQAEILNDPRMTALSDDWSRCMSEDGYSYSSSQAIMSQLDGEAREIFVGSTTTSDETALNEVNALVEDLARRERVLAIADWQCSEQLRTQGPAIIREHEVEFLRQNEAAIVALITPDES